MALVTSGDEAKSTVFSAPEGDCSKLRGALKRYENDENIEHFFRCVTLNHDCIVVSYDEDKDLQHYQG